jgi:hypothetical protein
MAKKADAWVVDYDAARARAIRWLGDRYLLAKPINRRAQGGPAGHRWALEPHRQPTSPDLKAG